MGVAGAAFRIWRVDVNNVCHAFAQAITNPGNDVAAVAMPHQYELVQFFGVSDAHDVVDMSCQPDLWATQVRTFAEAR